MPNPRVGVMPYLFPDLTLTVDLERARFYVENYGLPGLMAWLTQRTRELPEVLSARLSIDSRGAQIQYDLSVADVTTRAAEDVLGKLGLLSEPA